MQRIPHKSSSSQQSLVILILIILIIIAISVNVTLAWFYSRATESRIEVTGDILVATQVLNGKTMNFDEDELEPGALIERTIRIQKDSLAPNFYLRLKTEIRIDGIGTKTIDFNIAEQDKTYWLEEEIRDVEWYYCATDYDSWDSFDEDRTPLVHLEFSIPEDMSQDRLNRVITVIVYFELVAIDGDISHWQNLPMGWPFTFEELNPVSEPI